MSTTSQSEPFLFAPSGAGTVVAGVQGSPTVSTGSAPADSSDSSDPKGHPAQDGPSGSSDLPDVGPTGSDFINQARKEINQILRELAAATSQITDRRKYLRFLADRTLRAMAAPGIVIWQIQDPNSRQRTAARDAGSGEEQSPDDFGAEDGSPAEVTVAHRLGSQTDLGWTESQQRVHRRLLTDVLAEGQPVVVPPTPGADQPDTPANPTDTPAALVPVRLDPRLNRAEWLLEVFLEPHGTPASWRGALRFLAQVGDLAGEALRAERMRRQSEQLEWHDRIDAYLDSLRGLSRTTDIEAAWVDAAAECLACDRVSLCVREGKRVRLAAVGFVSRIDQRGAAAEAIREAAEQPLIRSGALAVASVETTDEQSADPNPPTTPAWVIGTEPNASWRLVITPLRPDGPDAHSDPEDAGLDELTATALRRLLIGGEQAWNVAANIESLPGGRWLTRRRWDVADGAVASQTRIRSRRRRQRLLAWTAAAMIAGTFWIPIPSVVTAPGVIRPAEGTSYHAPMDAVVARLHVTHGQHVVAGDPLVTLESADLRQRQITLEGRLAVLQQQRQRWKESLVRMGTSGSMADDAVGREVEEELASIDSRLAIIAETQESLVLRSRHAGRIDAWRVDETLTGRPLRRGDLVMRVIDEQSPWVVDARVPQRRVATVENAIREERLQAEAHCTFAPDLAWTAEVRRFGPVTVNPLDQLPAAVLRFELQPQPRDASQGIRSAYPSTLSSGRDVQERFSPEVTLTSEFTSPDGSDSAAENLPAGWDGTMAAETPARVTMQCGHVPLGWFLIEDMVTWCRTRMGAYLE